MKTIQLTFLFEDTGFCKDVFQSVNQPYYYCNRDTVDGTWYTSTPDDYQNDSHTLWPDQWERGASAEKKEA